MKIYLTGPGNDGLMFAKLKTRTSLNYFNIQFSVIFLPYKHAFQIFNEYLNRPDMVFENTAKIIFTALSW
jgi:hypothetical protein